MLSLLRTQIWFWSGGRARIRTWTCLFVQTDWLPKKPSGRTVCLLFLQKSACTISATRPNLASARVLQSCRGYQDSNLDKLVCSRTLVLERTECLNGKLLALFPKECLYQLGYTPVMNVVGGAPRTRTWSCLCVLRDWLWKAECQNGVAWLIAKCLYRLG